MELLKRIYKSVKRVLLCCGGSNESDDTHPIHGDPIPATGKGVDSDVVHVESPFGSKLNEEAPPERTNGEVPSSDVAPNNTVLTRDFAYSGVTNPPVELPRSNIPASPTQASVVPGLDPVVGSGVNGDRPDGVHTASTRQPRRKALLIGILYTTDPDWEDLDTPCKDVKHMKDFLLRNGYNEDCITTLCDSPDAESLGFGVPSLEGICDAMRSLVSDVEAGDYLFLHYCGHGSQIPADNFLELDGLDEVIIPLNAAKKYITDNELYTLLVQPLPTGCKLMTVWDCCHAGTMLDLPFPNEPVDQSEVRNNISPGGPSTRYKMVTAPRKTTYPQLENRIKIKKTMKRSPTSKTHDSYELRVSHPEPIILGNSRSGSMTPTLQTQLESNSSVRMGSGPLPDQYPIQSRTSTRSIEPTRSFTMTSNLTERAGIQMPPNFAWTDSNQPRPASPEPMDSPTGHRDFSYCRTSVEETQEEEGLEFFTSRITNGQARRHTFSLFNHQPIQSAQVISIAACHDDQCVFEVTGDDDATFSKTKSTGGLLTNTFIRFMEQESQRKTLDDMLHYLSAAFIQETLRMHSRCCRCGKECDTEDCKTPTEEDNVWKGQCINKCCPIPTIPPNPLISTLTDKVSKPFV